MLQLRSSNVFIFLKIMKERIRTIIAQVFDACRSEGMFSGELPDFVVESPRSREHGDLAVNVAMMLAKSEKKQPREIAQLLVARLQGCDPVIEKLEIAGPGFINFYLRQDAWHAVLGEIEAEGRAFRLLRGRQRPEGYGGVCERQSHGASAYRPWQGRCSG